MQRIGIPIMSMVCLFIASGCEDKTLLNGDGTSMEQPKQEKLAGNGPEAAPLVNSNTVPEDENLAPLPPQIVGGAFLTTQLLCGEVAVPGLPIAPDEAAFGCLVVDQDEQPIKLSGTQKSWDLTANQTNLIGLSIPFKEVPLSADSPFSGLFIVPKISLVKGIQTGLMLTGKGQQQVQYSPVVDVQTQAKSGNNRPLIIINQYGSGQ